MKMMKVMYAAKTAVAVIALLTLFAGCDRIKEITGKKNDGGAAAVQEAPTYAVNTSIAVKGQIRDYLALSGYIIASSTVDAYSDAAGKISRLYVSVGSRVGKGDPVVAVDPSRPGMDFVASVVKAPISGTVVALPAQLGMTISQAVPLVKISGGSGLEIRLYVAERFLSKIALRQLCEITLDAWPGEVFRGAISEVAPTVDPASRTMEVRVNVDNPGSKLKAGMFAKVKIITEQKNNIVKIPASAMIQRFGESYVFIAAADPANPANRIALRKVVVPGILIDGILEIQQGLDPDQEIVVRGQTLLEDGVRLNVIDRVTPLSVN
jgi:multidrug efflux pump subunit AcrA (membrane-fusion protein)